MNEFNSTKNTIDKVNILSHSLDAVGRGFSKLLWLLIHSQKIIVLVLLYSAANLLAYYALARVEASVYTVLLQVLLPVEGWEHLFLVVVNSNLK